MVIGPKRSAAWRILDAQYFGVAQRRRRVFVVAGSGDGFDPAEILFEREGMRRDFAPSRKQRKDVAGPITAGISKGMRGTEGIDSNWAVIHGTQDPCVSDIAFAQGRNNGGENVLVQPIAFNSKDYGSDATTDMSPTLRSLGAYDANGGGSMAVAQQMAVRRLTPRECERLQGFPDDYTDIPKAADGPRYKALGNSMAVPVMRWIGQRVQKHILPSCSVI
jgi:DNA (cytosine-5)-methyltransferase 1